MMMLLAFLAALGLAMAQTQPHIVFIIVDDLGWNDVSYRGAEYSTPTIDALAHSGILLDQYYVQPDCSPTRSALLSAKYPYNTGLAHEVICNGENAGLDPNITILPQVLKTVGYQTHAVGKWDIGAASWANTPTYRGFDSYFGYYGCDEDHFTHISASKLPFICSGLDLRNNTDVVENQNGTYSTTLFTQEMLRVINNYNDGDAPLFLYGAYQAIHSPIQVPEYYINNTECALIPERNRSIVCGMMKVIDEGIFNITQLLIEKQMFDNTLFIFSSDNGGQNNCGGNNWPLRGNKATVWDGGIRVNGFVAGFGVADNLRNTTNYGMMHVTDWLPTLAHLTNADISSLDIDGIDAFDTIFSNATSLRTEMLIQLDPPFIRPEKGFPRIGQAAYRLNDWKLILGIPNCTVQAYKWQIPGAYCPDTWIYVNGTQIPAPPTPSLVWLFNLADDPYEYHNIADENPDIVEQLRARIELYNSTHIPQQAALVPASHCPVHFTPKAWTPWS